MFYAYHRSAPSRFFESLKTVPAKANGNGGGKRTKLLPISSSRDKLKKLDDTARPGWKFQSVDVSAERVSAARRCGSL